MSPDLLAQIEEAARRRDSANRVASANSPTWVPFISARRNRRYEAAIADVRIAALDIARLTLQYARELATQKGYPEWRVLNTRLLRSLDLPERVAELMPLLNGTSMYGSWDDLRHQPQYHRSSLEHEADGRPLEDWIARGKQAAVMLDSEQESHLQNYTVLTTSYDLNKDTPWLNADSHVPDDILKGIESAMHLIGHLQEGATVYRGEMYPGATMDGIGWKSDRLRQIHGISPGEVLTWEHPVSTAILPSVRRFVGQFGLADQDTGYGATSVVFQINDVKRGILMEPFAPNHLQSEREMLLPAGSSFRVLEHQERRLSDRSRSGPYHVIQLSML